MGWAVIRRFTPEDADVLTERLRAFCERHDIRVDKFDFEHWQGTGDEWRAYLLAALYWAESGWTEEAYRMKLLRGVWRRALRAPSADLGIGWGYVGRQSEY